MSKLDDYLGHYALGNGMYVSVRREEQTLYGQITSLPELPLYVSGPDAFRIVPANPNFEIGLAFERDDEGRVVAVEVTQKHNNQKDRGPRLHQDARSLEGSLAPIGGAWQAVLGFPGARLHVTLHLFANGAGALDGYLSLPEQRASYFPLSAISLEDDQLELASEVAGASFSGQLKRKGPSITALKGQWTLRGRKSKAIFKPTES